MPVGYKNILKTDKNKLLESETSEIFLTCLSTLIPWCLLGNHFEDGFIF